MRRHGQLAVLQLDLGFSRDEVRCDFGVFKHVVGDGNLLLLLRVEVVDHHDLLAVVLRDERADRVVARVNGFRVLGTRDLGILELRPDNPTIEVEQRILVGELLLDAAVRRRFKAAAEVVDNDLLHVLAVKYHRRAEVRVACRARSLHTDFLTVVGKGIARE